MAKGLEVDAVIVEGFIARLARFEQDVNATKTDLERDWGRRVSVQDLSKVASSLPLTHRIGDDGGFVYGPDGTRGSWFKDKQQLEEHSQSLKDALANGYEVINFHFSKLGEKDFCRAMGVLHDKEELIDLAAILKSDPKKFSGNFINAKQYNLSTATTIPGVELNLRKDPNNFGGRAEEEVALTFNREFIEAILPKNENEILPKAA